MISSLVPALISAFKARRELALENVALRQQLAVLRRSVKRPRLSNVDRVFWVLLRRIWTDWESVLVIVKPETVIRWHRCGFRRYWTWKSRRRRLGRPGAPVPLPASRVATLDGGSTGLFLKGRVLAQDAERTSTSAVEEIERRLASANNRYGVERATKLILSEQMFGYEAATS